MWALVFALGLACSVLPLEPRPLPLVLSHVSGLLRWLFDSGVLPLSLSITFALWRELRLTLSCRLRVN